MANVKAVSRKLSQRERTYIAYCEKFYFLHNQGFPSNEQAAAALQYSTSEINVFLQNQKVIDALERRGLPWKSAGGFNSELSPTQVAVALTMSNFADERSISNKLSDLGIHPQQYYTWLNDPQFQNYVQRMADRNLEIIRPEAVAAFSQLVRKGDFQAIKYYFEVTGQFVNPDVSSIQGMVQKLVESVQRHVKDPETLAAISKDILGAAPVAANTASVTASIVPISGELSV